MKKLLFMFIILIASLLVSGCNNNSVNQIKADYFDIGFGQSLYEGYNKIDKETVQSLVKAYNQIEYSGQTNQQINNEKAITITFIYSDQISGILVIDDKGIFHLKDSSVNYQIEPNNTIYEQAMEIYNDVKKQY
ncbi:hypothetical protein NCCP2222_25120 [Sporosarcina sp. NCCP-2222]|uniref:hypothetical protein n=1 Tax=Sporosarcina sp. NCCP-2222 TaxID=2935073 RepID=UPI00208C4E25|nr:hypothetical protein [Sporosarcina sp. NCCP-2222]GKV56565.1 hypothetical protein NCCP2222_25120 [Sporosarcina sp. NCCP-2222]